MRQELIILVNNQGQQIGTAPKLASHHANTPLHLAFSCYVFNQKGQLLVTQRALSKKVWPGVWTNTVCGHPAPGEDMIDAIKRRLKYELGMKGREFKLVLSDYRYKTPLFNGVMENEVCPVYFAKAVMQPKPNPAEVGAYKWMSWQDFVKASEKDHDEFSYWSKDQIKLLKNHPQLKTYAKA